MARPKGSGYDWSALPADDVLWGWIERGYTLSMIARRLGLHYESLREHLRRHRGWRRGKPPGRVRSPTVAVTSYHDMVARERAASIARQEARKAAGEDMHGGCRHWFGVRKIRPAA